jgi:hypothetical protein
LRWGVGAVLAVAVLMFCYLRIAGTTPVVSDGAGNALQSWDMIHGNFLLSGWWATDVSFSTSALPVYALVELVAGLRPEALHIAAAVMYTVTVLLAAIAARGRATGAVAGFSSLLAVVIMLAPEPGVGAYVVLGPPSHVITLAPLLLLIMLLDRAPRRWWVPVAVGLLLTIGLVGDPLIMVVGALPLAAVCLVRIIVTVHRSQTTVRAMWYESALIVVAGLAMAAARLVNLLVQAAGGLRVNSLPGQGTSRMLPGLPLAARNLLSVFGADPGGVPTQRGGDPSGGPAHPQSAVELVFAVVHLAGVVLVVIAIALAARHLLRSLSARRDETEPDLPSGLMVVAIVVNILLFFTIFNVEDPYGGREVGPVLVLGAVLAGRQLGPRLAQPLQARVPLQLASTALLAVNIGMLGFAATQPQVQPANLALTSWLEQHGLRHGLADYWDATSVTLDSQGAVTIGPVVRSHVRPLVPYKWEADLRQFNPATHQANFLVLPEYPAASKAIVIAAFGPPAVVYHFQTYTILVWHKNLLPDLKPAAAP